MERKRVLPGSRAAAERDAVHWHSSRKPSTERPASEPESQNLIDTSQGASKRVLVLDDDEEVTSVLTAILETQGYEVTMVNRAVEGLVAVMTCDFDAIICDMVMPSMPGDMYYTAVSRAKPHLCSRFVFITGHASNPKVSEFLAKMLQPVLYKPFGMDELLEAVVKTVTSAQCPASKVASNPALNAAACTPRSRGDSHSKGMRVPATLVAEIESPRSEVTTSDSSLIVPI